MHKRPLIIESLATVAYGDALSAQEERHHAIREGRAPDTLMLLEHAPVVTAGRNTQPHNLLTTPDGLRARGIDYFDIGRGGDVTYHGPGQLVGYPLLKLEGEEQDLRRYVSLLEEALIATARDFGVEATRVPGLRGIWVGNDKLAAIGIRIAQWVTMHGFALNVNCDLTPFGLIVPCGLAGRGVTSLAKLTGRSVALVDVKARVVAHIASLLGREPVWSCDAPRIRRTAS